MDSVVQCTGERFTKRSRDKVVKRDWSTEIMASTDDGSAWASIKEYLEVCDDSYSQLTLEHGQPVFPDGVPAVVCVVRNEEERLPSFLEHYADIGVTKFHIIDNASSDLTRSIAKAWPG